MDDNLLAGWLDREMAGHYLPEFLRRVREHRDGLAKEALREGNTDHTKGQVAALDWVVDLPEAILRQRTGADTSETAPKAQ